MLARAEANAGGGDDDEDDDGEYRVKGGGDQWEKELSSRKGVPSSISIKRKATKAELGEEEEEEEEEGKKKGKKRKSGGGGGKTPGKSPGKGKR